MTRRCAAGLLALIAVTLAPAMARGCSSASAEGAVRVEAGHFSLLVRLDPPSMPVGRFLVAEIAVWPPDAGAPVERVSIDAVMPAHGHGMNYAATVAPAGPGRWLASGLMLHMPGLWRFRVTVTGGGRSEVAVFERTAGP